MTANIFENIKKNIIHLKETSIYKYVYMSLEFHSRKTKRLHKDTALDFPLEVYKCASTDRIRQRFLQLSWEVV